jgi:hypothetical protein
MMDDSIELSTSILGDLMLDCANLGKIEKLMVLTSTANSRDLDDIAHALLEQHPKIHVEEKQSPHERKPGCEVRTRKPTRKWTRYANLAGWYADDEEEAEPDYHISHWHYDDEEGEGEA